MVELEHLHDMLTKLGLDAAEQRLDALLEEAVHKETTFVSFLNRLMEFELQSRKEQSERTRLKFSRMPYIKTIDEFDFNFPKNIDEQQIRELAELAFIQRKENVILLGPPGIGKSHLAVALAEVAIHNGFTAYFTSLTSFITEMKKATACDKLEKRLKVYLHPDVLVLDEIGYASLDRESATLLFRLVCGRYETGSMILTSNKRFSDWGELMGDAVIASAILDRLLHHCHVVNIRGESYRLKDRLKLGVQIVPPSPQAS
ncbi:MAG TPA: AAA family ATPase [Clostridiaceae bacterium]|nr:AAA family ATPase [Clostridiaceae bacterium]